jgi:hypothetical protein
VRACSFESSTTCGSNEFDELLDDEVLDDEVVEELLVDEELIEEDVASPDAAWSLFPGFAGFPRADAPVTTTATSDATKARASASFRKTISSPWMELSGLSTPFERAKYRHLLLTCP